VQSPLPQVTPGDWDLWSGLIHAPADLFILQFGAEAAPRHNRSVDN
jgi:hypothetical protein